MKRTTIAAIFALMAVPAFAQPQNPSNVALNEIYASHTGTDDYEMIELIGNANGALTSYVVCIVEGEGTGSNQGVLDRAWDLTGYFLDVNGYFVLADTAETSKDYDLGATNSIENGTETFYVVYAPNPMNRAALLMAVGTDVDANDDLITDLSSYGDIVDLVAMVDADYDSALDNVMDFATVVGPDVTVFPAGIFRDEDHPSKWCQDFLDFDDVANVDLPRTPKAQNTAYEHRTYGSPRCTSANGRMRFWSSGDTTAGTGSIDLAIVNGPSSRPAGVFYGLTETDLTMSGGCKLLVGPVPLFVVFTALDANGDWSLTGIPLPAGLSGFTIYMQAISQEADGSFIDANAIEVEFL